WTTDARKQLPSLPIINAIRRRAVRYTALMEHPHDPQTRLRRLPPLLPQTQPQDRQTSQPRYLQDPRGRRKARTRRPVLQARRLSASGTWVPWPRFAAMALITHPNLIKSTPQSADPAPAAMPPRGAPPWTSTPGCYSRAS